MWESVIREGKLAAGQRAEPLGRATSASRFPFAHP